MGLFFVIAIALATIAFFSIRALLTKNRDSGYVLLVIMGLIVFTMISFGIIGPMNTSFEKEKLLKYDKTVEVYTVVNAESEEEYVFDYFGEIKAVSSVDFYRVIKGDSNKMLVHLEERWTPTSFMHFRSSTKRSTLIMPKASR